MAVDWGLMTDWPPTKGKYENDRLVNNRGDDTDNLDISNLFYWRNIMEKMSEIIEKLKHSGT